MRWLNDDQFAILSIRFVVREKNGGRLTAGKASIWREEKTQLTFPPQLNGAHLTII